jgi:phosphatidylserine decarboxylase
MFDKNMLLSALNVRFHHAAWPFVLIALLIAMVFYLLQWKSVAVFFVTLALFFLYFFRHPRRCVSDVPNAVVSPADGTIVEIEDSVFPSEYGMSDDQCTKIGIFLSPFDVHINRIPFEGIIEQNVYTPGQFFNAASRKASTQNEQRGVVIRTSTGVRMLCVQIAGFLARRIVCNVQRGDSVKKGMNYGLICFGSRVDLYVPKTVTIFVKVGQGLRGGESIIGLLE